MSRAMRISRGSYWLHGPMNTPIPTYQSLFTRDLEVSFGASAGRALLAELEAATMATFGAVNGLTLARQLQTSSEASDATLCFLVDRARSDQRLISLVLVALEPEITAVGKRIGRSWLNAERSTDLFLAASDVLQQPFRSRVTTAQLICTTARSASRHHVPRGVTIETIDPNFDGVDPSTLPQPAIERAEILQEAPASGTFTKEEIDLLVVTRVNGVTLATYANQLGVKMTTLRMRRHRIEERLAAFIRSEEQR